MFPFTFSCAAVISSNFLEAQYLGFYPDLIAL